MKFNKSRSDSLFSEIQSYYDDGNSSRVTSLKYGVANFRWAERRGLKRRSQAESQKLRQSVMRSTKIPETHDCHWCGLPFIAKTKRKPNNPKFCNGSCATYFQMSDPARRDISSAVFRKYRRRKIAWTRECEACGDEFTGEGRASLRKTCSATCAKILQLSGSRRGGLISASKAVKRSKNETLFYELVLLQFSDAKCNTAIFNGWDADVLIPSLKIAVLWNGPWHYRKITKRHSVTQVQNRDRIKIREILSAGWLPVIIRDPGKSNARFVQSKFQDFMQFVSETQSRGYHKAESSVEL